MYPYLNYYIIGERGHFTDGLSKKQIDYLLKYGMITPTDNPYKYLVHKDYFLDDILDELETI